MSQTPEEVNALAARERVFEAIFKNTMALANLWVTFSGGASQEALAGQRFAKFMHDHKEAIRKEVVAP